MQKKTSSQAIIYPPSPIADRKKLLNPGRSYQTKVVFVLFGVIAFWLLYFALVALGVWGFIWLLYLPMLHTSYGILLKIGSLATAGMFMLFLLKFLFKSWSWQDASLVEIKESEQPQLFAFLRQLSKEVGAPFPKKVFVNHEINAKVFYTNPMLSLFLPVRKNLHIGLGLVNSLNLTELKAVLAHEFGHFSQGSMRLGSYVYMANRIIYDMVYSRDKWDQWLEQWKASDIRLSFFAWALMPFVWLVRTIMVGMYRTLNLLQSSLSRQMEFHADRVAVSAAGSAAIVHALYKLDAASQAFGFAVNQVRAAFDHHLYTDDIFYHQRKAYNFLKNTQENFRKDLLENVLNKEKETTTYLFKKEDTAVPDMYASHPAGYLRETNAKAIFVAAEEDNRSAWVLFENVEALSQKITKHILHSSLNLPPHAQFSAASEVQAFIDEELKETSFDPRYKGYYGNRYLTVPESQNVDILVETFNIHSAEDLEYQFENLYGSDFATAYDVILADEKEVNSMIALLPIAHRKKSVKFKDKTYSLSELKQHIEDFEKQKEGQHSDWFQKRDALVFAVHLKALQLMGQPTDAFLERHDFQWQLQATYYQLEGVYNHFREIIQAVMQKGRLEEKEVLQVAGALVKCSKAATDALKQIANLRIPPLTNMESVGNLRPFLAPKALPPFSSLGINSEDVSLFDKLMQEILERCLRLFRKNLGRIVQEMEAVEQAWKARG